MRPGDRVRVQEPHTLAGMTGEILTALMTDNQTAPVPLAEARFRARLARVQRVRDEAA